MINLIGAIKKEIEEFNKQEFTLAEAIIRIELYKLSYDKMFSSLSDQEKLQTDCTKKIVEEFFKNEISDKSTIHKKE